MKKEPQLVFTVLFTLMLAVSHGQQKSQDFPVLKGPYLGQKPPGNKARPFAGIIFESRYRWLHANIIFTADGNEAYWQSDTGDGSRLQAVFESSFKNGIWTTPQVAFFSVLVEGGMEDSPFISPDGKKFYFLSGRPIKKGGESGKYNIWVMDKKDEGWSNPQPLPPVVNSMEGIHWRLSVDESYNLYFGTWKPREGGKTTGDIFCSQYNNGEYSKPEILGPEINVPGYNRSPFIAPDGSYLIFSRSKPAEPTMLFICFRSRVGEWTNPRSIQPIIGREGGCPIVTVDGKYLFFLVAGKPYWINAGFIEELRKTDIDLEGDKNV